MRFFHYLTLTALTISLGTAHAALPEHSQAPNFTNEATQGGHQFTYTLKNALKKGAVVLYFYPAAFTKGCTIEAHQFAEAIPDFTKQGATVIGISMDNVATLKKFSISECRSAFPVAADPSGRTTDAYKARADLKRTSTRTSYVIAPNGMILMSYTNNDPDEHVSHALTALTNYHSQTHGQ